MQFGDEIVKIIDALAQKFGAVIDWSQNNVLPQVQKICEKYLTYEIWTSIIAIVICVVILLFLPRFVLNCGSKWHEEHKNDYSYDGIFPMLCNVFVCLIWVTVSIIIISQTIDIVRCCVFPEYQIYLLLNKLKNY